MINISSLYEITNKSENDTRVSERNLDRFYLPSMWAEFDSGHPLWLTQLKIEQKHYFIEKKNERIRKKGDIITLFSVYKLA